MFWIISAILVAIALAFILPALFKSDASQDATREQNISIAREQLLELEHRYEKGGIDKEGYQSSKDELELALFNDLKDTDAIPSDSINKSGSSSVSTWLILLLIPLIAVPAYLQLGNLKFTTHFDPKMVAQEAAISTMPLKADGTPDVEKIAENLKAEMNANPTDPKGWFMLGRTYMMLNRFSEAASSFDKSLSLRPELAETKLALADALSMNNNGQLIGRPRTLVGEALSAEPTNITALWLSGMAASQEGEYSEAIKHWNNVLPLIKDKPEEVAAVEGLITEAKSRLGATDQNKVSKPSSDTVSQTEEKKDTKVAEVKVSVSLSNDFANKVSPDDFVFIYAKAMTGPPMPLAAVRKRVKELPFEITLNDAQAMMPNLKISSFKALSVGARISKTGDPIGQNGDYFNEKSNIALGDSISLEIDQILTK